MNLWGHLWTCLKGRGQWTRHGGRRRTFCRTGTRSDSAEDQKSFSVRNREEEKAKYSQSHHFWKREGEKVSLLLLLFIGLEFFAYQKLNVSKWKCPSFYFSHFSAGLPLPSIPTARRTTRTTSLSRPTASWSRAKSSTDTLTWPKIAWSTWGCFKER